jgi:hypothetical protein
MCDVFYYKMQTRFQIQFHTPAFLGDANQSGRWRTPPFKAQLRQWWRVAYAAQQQFAVNVREMRDNDPPLPAPAKSTFDMARRDSYSEEYRAIVDPLGETDAILLSLKSSMENGMEEAYFSQRKAKLEKRMETAPVPVADACRKQDGNSRTHPFGENLGHDAEAFEAHSAIKTETI